MKRSRSLLIRLLVVVSFLLIAVVLTVLLTSPSDDATRYGTTAMQGKEAPIIEATALTGERVNTRELRGRYITVTFFATWCDSCKASHPEFVAYAKQIANMPNAPQMLYVATDKGDFSKAQHYLDADDAKWPIVPDKEGDLALNFAIRGIPETFVINPEGKVSAHIAGDDIDRQWLSAATQVATQQRT